MFGGARCPFVGTLFDRRDAQHYLCTQEAYTLHRQARRRFLRHKTHSEGIADIYQADLFYLSGLSNFNNSYCYLLTCIDVFTKRAWATKMSRYFTYKNLQRYIDVLPRLVASYNTSYHHSIGMSPNEVNANNEDHVRKRLYPRKKKARRACWHFELGDRVRMTSSCRTYNPFEKGYAPKWTHKLFVVCKRVPTTLPTYKLSDEMGEPIKGKKGFKRYKRF